MDTLETELESAKSEFSTYVLVQPKYKDWLYTNRETIECWCGLVGIIGVFTLIFLNAKVDDDSIIGKIFTSLIGTYFGCLIGWFIYLIFAEVVVGVFKRLGLTSYYDTRQKLEANISTAASKISNAKWEQSRLERQLEESRKREAEKEARKIELAKKRKERSEEHKQRTLQANAERQRALVEDLKVKQAEEAASTESLIKPSTDSQINPPTVKPIIVSIPDIVETTSAKSTDDEVIPKLENESATEAKDKVKPVNENFEEDQGKSFTEIFTPKISENQSTRKFTATYLPKQNHLELQEKKIKIGEIGERIALEFEQRRFTRLGFDITKIVQVSLTNDAAGYDFKSLDNQGNEMFIEVKSTISNDKEPFILTELEMYRFTNEKNYWIYRVHSIDLETGKGHLYIIDKREPPENYYDIRPIQFKFSPKR